MPSTLCHLYWQRAHLEQTIAADIQPVGGYMDITDHLADMASKFARQGEFDDYSVFTVQKSRICANCNYVEVDLRRFAWISLVSSYQTSQDNLPLSDYDPAWTSDGGAPRGSYQGLSAVTRTAFVARHRQENTSLLNALRAHLFSIQASVHQCFSRKNNTECCGEWYITHTHAYCCRTQLTTQ
jgi:hypothetical protein